MSEFNEWLNGLQPRNNELIERFTYLRADGHKVGVAYYLINPATKKIAKGVSLKSELDSFARKAGVVRARIRAYEALNTESTFSPVVWGSKGNDIQESIDAFKDSEYEGTGVPLEDWGTVPESYYKAQFPADLAPWEQVLVDIAIESTPHSSPE